MKNLHKKKKTKAKGKAKKAVRAKTSTKPGSKSMPYFIKSAVEFRDYPIHEGVEVAFLGASNSGKSTLVNGLLGKNLCKTSSQPGHTALINFFSVKKGLHFVDFPGYGYAKKSKKEQEKWQKFIETYMESRDQLALCFVLFDLKRGIMANDEALLNWLDTLKLPYSLVATKVDKLNQKEQSKAKRGLDELGYGGGLLHFTSALKNKGMKKLWDQIDGLIVKDETVC